MTAPVALTRTMRGHPLRKLRCMLRRRHEWQLAGVTYRVRRTFDSSWRREHKWPCGKRCAYCGRAEVSFRVTLTTVGRTRVEDVRVVTTDPANDDERSTK